MPEKIIRYEGGGDARWLRWGLCNPANPNNANPDGINFSEPGGMTKRAVRICKTPCPVKDDCLRYALVNNVDTGVMAGTFPKERKPMIAEFRKAMKTAKKAP